MTSDAIKRDATEHARLGKFEEAIASMQRYAAQGNISAYDLQSLGRWMFSAKRHDEALHTFDAALRHVPIEVDRDYSDRSPRFCAYWRAGMYRNICGSVGFMMNIPLETDEGTRLRALHWRWHELESSLNETAGSDPLPTQSALERKLFDEAIGAIAVARAKGESI